MIWCARRKLKPTRSGNACAGSSRSAAASPKTRSRLLSRAAFVSLSCSAPGSIPTAYRAPHSQDLRIFEVDHPATQAWKRQRLAEADIPLPAALTFVPVDFERETLADGLAAAGFDPAQQTFFTLAWRRALPHR